MMERYVRVFRKDIAMQLIDENYKLLKTEPNWNCPKLKVFIFDEADGINNRLNELIHK